MRFILIDRLVSLEAGKSVVACRRVQADDDYFKDHFPGFPVVPGVLLTEMMAQTAGKCLDAERRPRGKAMLAKILSASFRQWVRPGDQLLIHADIVANEERYATAVESLSDAYGDRLEGVPFLRIHGDCHLGNLLRGRDGWFFLDFDDFAVGPAVHDVWVLVPGQDREALRQRGVLLDGYRQFRDFEPRWLDLVEPLRAARMLKISSWIARRWKESSFESTFPHFGTELYWERETRDLEELVLQLTA